jgi:hypothetical protein
MKKMIIGSLVGTLIFFTFQSLLWIGGFHNDFSIYSPNQVPVMNALSQNLSEDGVYMMPSADPKSQTLKQDEEKIMKEGTGKPWAMIFYHKSDNFSWWSRIIRDIFYTLISSLIVCLVLSYGSFQTFTLRFLVAIGFAVFTICQGVLDDIFPWSFVKASVIDLTFAWGLTSIWLAWYMKN